MLVLTYDLTYWDRLGWKDTFGNSEFDQRQRDYTKALQRQNVFTPQVNNSATLISVVIANCLLGHHQRPDRWRWQQSERPAVLDHEGKRFWHHHVGSYLIQQACRKHHGIWTTMRTRRHFHGALRSLSSTMSKSSMVKMADCPYHTAMW